MTPPAEVTITAADYWATRPAELMQFLLGGTGTRTLPDPSGRPPDPKNFAVVIAPESWEPFGRELEEALAGTTATAPATGAAAGAVAPQADRLVLTVEEAATLLGISRAFAYEAVGRGEIPSIRIGRRILVPKAALDRLVGVKDDEVMPDVETGSVPPRA